MQLRGRRALQRGLQDSCKGDCHPRPNQTEDDSFSSHTLERLHHDRGKR